jgi:hypothetical protein
VGSSSGNSSLSGAPSSTSWTSGALIEIVMTSWSLLVCGRSNPASKSCADTTSTSFPSTMNTSEPSRAGAASSASTESRDPSRCGEPASPPTACEAIQSPSSAADFASEAARLASSVSPAACAARLSQTTASTRSPRFHNDSAVSSAQTTSSESLGRVRGMPFIGAFKW